SFVLANNNTTSLTTTTTNKLLNNNNNNNKLNNDIQQQQRYLSATPSPNTTKETFLPVEHVMERVLSVVKSFPKVDAKKVTPKANFMTDLGLDSLDTVELVMMFEEEFVLTIPDDQAEKILTVEDAVNFISKHPQAR